ncbi:MAG: hypothetical protein AAGH40_07725 [Verrucomicrobiota bacterium]
MDVFFLSVLVTSCLLLSGCSTRSPQKYLNLYNIQPPTVEDFETCASIGCKRRSNLSYTKEEWKQIRDRFTPLAANAAEEREQISLAIALMEQINGPKNNTHLDNPRNKVLGAKGSQLDCIAETVNTTVGLILLKQEGLIRFHDIGHPEHRGFAQFRLPHNTATILEKETENCYTVDSWVGANGELPKISLISEWKASRF